VKNNVAIPSKKEMIFCLVFCIFFVASGCSALSALGTGAADLNNALHGRATSGFGKADSNAHEITMEDRMNERLNDLIGHLTFDEALVQFGAPQQMVKGDNIVVVVWRQENGFSGGYTELGNYGIPGTQAAGTYFGGGGIMYGSTHGSELTMTFAVELYRTGQERKIMSAWKHRRW
jgi:hypothetical protein